MTREIFFAPAAITDLEQIRDYIAADNPAAAAGLLTAVEDTCELFGRNPGIGTRRDDLLPDVRLVSLDLQTRNGADRKLSCSLIGGGARSAPLP